MNNELRIKVTRILLNSKQLTGDEVSDIHELMCLAISTLVKEEEYIPTKCPNCREVLSVSHGDGYYSCEHVEFCPSCMQKLKWENDDID